MEHRKHQHGFVLGEPEKPAPIMGFEDFGSIPLKKVKNVRDLGGLMASDGRHVKPHTLIRASALHHATHEDLETLLEDYDLMRVVDLRTDQERHSAPDPMERLPGVTLYALPVFGSGAVGVANGATLAQQAKSVLEIQGNPFQVVSHLYEVSFTGELGIQAFKELLHLLLDAEEGSTLWHCTEGKDRTGLASVLVEYALGIPEDYIRRDYLATNIFMANPGAAMMDSLGMHHILQSLDADLEALYFAHIEYLESALRAVREHFGGMGPYMRDALDFGPDAIEELRAKYLTH